MGKRILSSILCVAMTLSLAACGKQEPISEVDSTKDYVYVPEYITLSDDENGHYSNLILKENSLYYSEYRYDEEAMTSTESICQYSLEDGSVKQIPISFAENRNLSGYALDGNGNIYVLLSDYSTGKVDEEGFSIADMFLYKYDSQGTMIFEKNITDIISREVEESYTRGIFVDEQGQIYICMENAILLFNADGEEHGTVAISDGWINNVGLGKDGKVYFCYYDYTSSVGGMVLSEIDFQAKKIGATYQNLPNMNGDGLSMGITKDFLINDGSKVYEYDLATQTYEEVFSWLDCDIDGSYVSYVGTTAAGEVVAVINDWDTGITELAKLIKKDAAEVVQKKEIVIGALYNDQQLQAAAVAFNKSNDTYRVTIKNYIDNNNWDGDSYNTAITNLQNDIVSGTNCPDIIDLSQLGDERALAAKGVFEDLTPYLEKSSAISKEDFLDTVLEGFSYEGKLLSIPRTFNIQTLAGKTSVVGDKMGWTLEDMMECVQKYPDAELLEGYQKSSVLYMSILFNTNSYINWEAGECYFNTDTFKQVLEFANLFPNEYNWEDYDGSGRVEKLQTNATLLLDAGIYDLQEIQVYEAQFGEPVTFVGYPTADGSAGCMMYADTRYGIVSKSDNKDGAWAFIESYLTNDAGDRYSWGIPTRKELFEEMITEMTTPDYVLDENGEPMLDENGEPMISGTSSMSSDGWEYTYHTPTMEDAQVLRDLVAVAKPMGFMNEELTNILLEEVEAYFAGEKTVDEVANIIQSRAQIYISENS